MNEAQYSREELLPNRTYTFRLPDDVRRYIAKKPGVCDRGSIAHHLRTLIRKGIEVEEKEAAV